MTPTMIRPCTCRHAQQDKMYGYGKRLHNWAVKKDAWRCTVCSYEKKINN